MLLENPKTGTLGIVYESAISEKTVPMFFFAKKNCSKMKLHDLYIDGKKKCQSFARHGGESHIFCIQAILTGCSKAKSTRSRESRIPITRLSKMTSDM